MLKRFLKDSVIYGCTIALTRIIGVFLIPLYTAILTPQEYGVLDSFNIFFTFLNIIVPLEVSQAVARFIPEKDSLEGKTKIASTGLLYILFSYFVFSFILLLQHENIFHVFWGESASIKVFMFGFAANFLSSIFYFLQILLRYQLKPMNFMVSNLLYSLICISSSAYFILYRDYGIMGFFGGNAVGAVFGIISSYIGSRDILAMKFSWAEIKEMLTFSLPIVPSTISVFLSNYLDRIFLVNLLSFAELGVYGIGFRVSSVLGIFLSGLQNSLTPIILQNYKKEDSQKELAMILRLFLYIIVPVLAGITIFSHDVVLLIFRKEYHAAWKVIPLIALSSVVSQMYIFAPGLDIEKKTKEIAKICLCSPMFCVFFNSVFIPLFGSVGAAFARLLVSIIIFYLYMSYSQKLYYVPHEWRRLFFVSLLLLLALGFTYLSSVFPFMDVFAIKVIFFILCSLSSHYLLLPQFSLVKFVTKRITAL